jgi:hypothetical protein
MRGGLRIGKLYPNLIGFRIIAQYTVEGSTQIRLEMVLNSRKSASESANEDARGRRLQI